MCAPGTGIDWTTIIGSAASAVIGGLIAGGASWLVMVKSHKNQQDLATTKENHEIKCFLQAIYDEITTLTEFYSRVGDMLDALPEGVPFVGIYPIFQDYFTVYHANANLLGRIDDDDLRKAIVVYYSKAKGLVDSFRHNNDLNQQRDFWKRTFNETKNSIHKRNYEIYEMQLIEYAKGLKSYQKDLKMYFHDLVSRIQKEGK